MHSRFASLFIWPLFIWCERRWWPVWVRMCMCQNIVYLVPSLSLIRSSERWSFVGCQFLNAKPKATAFMRVGFGFGGYVSPNKTQKNRGNSWKTFRKKENNICFIHLELHLTKEKHKITVRHHHSCSTSILSLFSGTTFSTLTRLPVANSSFVGCVSMIRFSGSMKLPWPAARSDSSIEYGSNSSAFKRRLWTFVRKCCCNELSSMKYLAQCRQ